MNTTQDRKRLVWLAVIGGVLLLSLLFITLMKPSPHPGAEDPVLRPQSQESLFGDTTPVAGTTTATTGSGEASGFSLGGGEAFSLAWRIALVGIIIAVSIAGLRWWGKRASGPRSVTGFLRVVDTLAISNGRTIHLVALGDRVIAVGATAQQLTLLNELTDGEAAEVLASVPATTAEPFANFAAELFQQMRGGNTARASRRREITIGEEPR